MRGAPPERRPLKIAETILVSAKILHNRGIFPVRLAVPGVIWGYLCLQGATANADEALPPPGHPKTERAWSQYGAALVSEGRAKAGDICPPDATAPCILGSGGGIALRGGRRSQQGWYLGAAYEFSRQDAANLLRLPILQQVRGEARYYLLPGQRLEPYLTGALGVAAYGGEWGVETYGPLISLGLGLELETSRGVFFGGMLSYRVLRLEGWQDKTGQERPDAFAHFIALEVTMEVRTPVARW